SGLQHDPGNVEAVQKVIGLGRRIRDAGGAVPGGADVKGPAAPMLAALEALAADPESPARMERLVRAAAGAPTVAGWLADQFLAMLQAALKRERDPAAKPRLILLTDHFESRSEYAKAELAASEALRLDPLNYGLQKRVRDLAALKTTDDGGYKTAA